MDRQHNTDPQQLLLRARDGDEAAFADLLGLYRNYLAVLARVHIDRQLQSKADQSDLVQETLMQAHKDFPQFRGSSEGELIVWLRKIMATKGAMLADALAQLSDDHREVMILHHLEGRPMAEVAVRMGRSVNAVQKLWARALVKMRHIMGGEPCD